MNELRQRPSPPGPASTYHTWSCHAVISRQLSKVRPGQCSAGNTQALWEAMQMIHKVVLCPFDRCPDMLLRGSLTISPLSPPQAHWLTRDPPSQGTLIGQRGWK